MPSYEAKARSPAALEEPSRPMCCFATLQLTNAFGQKSMNALGKSYSKLSKHHRKYLKVIHVGMSAQINNLSDQFFSLQFFEVTDIWLL